jgi:hypothetical protein
MLFSGLGKIGMQAPVSYPSIVWGAVAAISASATVNVDKGIPSFRHAAFHLASGIVVGWCE